MTNLSTPVVPLEWPVYPDLDQDFHACGDCLPWSFDVVVNHPNGGVWVREWHAENCPYLLEIEAVRRGDFE